MSGTDVGTSGTEVLAVAAPAAAVFAIAKPGVAATAAVAGASGATASGVVAPGTSASTVAASDVAAPGAGTSATAALGAIGLAEAAAPELLAPAVAPVVAIEAPVAWTPADEPTVVEELPGREALTNKEKKPSAKSEASRIRGVNGRTLTQEHRASSVHGGSSTASAPVAAAVAHLVAGAAPVTAAEAHQVAAAAAPMVMAEAQPVAAAAVATGRRHLLAVVVAARLLRRSRESWGPGSYPGPRPQRSSNAFRWAP